MALDDDHDPVPATRMIQPSGTVRWGGKGGLVIALSPEDVETVRALAVYPEVRADHVTLAFGVAREDVRPAWVPGGLPLGEVVAIRVVGMAMNGRVQALLIEVGGSTRRPQDGELLHITVSKQHDARSSESNELLKSAVLEPMDLVLRGVVDWWSSPSDRPSGFTAHFRIDG